tara:strand:- start:2364 stop:2846 length:483 start_codon:yes stop_codon:yes gene_type:complete
MASNKYIPIHPSHYDLNQVIINSDRLVFNSKKDSILLYSDKAIGFSANRSIHFDTSPDKEKSQFVINSPNIYLGLEYDKKLAIQSAVLGDELIDHLTKICGLISQLYYDLASNISFTTTTVGEECATNEVNFDLAEWRFREINDYVKTLHSIKSKKVKLV